VGVGSGWMDGRLGWFLSRSPCTAGEGAGKPMAGREVKRQRAPAPACVRAGASTTVAGGRGVGLAPVPVALHCRGRGGHANGGDGGEKVKGACACLRTCWREHDCGGRSRSNGRAERILYIRALGSTITQNESEPYITDGINGQRAFCMQPSAQPLIGAGFFLKTPAPCSVPGKAPPFPVLPRGHAAGRQIRGKKKKQPYRPNFPQRKEKKNSHTAENAKKKKTVIHARICDELNNWPPGAKTQSKQIQNEQMFIKMSYCSTNIRANILHSI
jgi:hypothetical protein